MHEINYDKFLSGFSGCCLEDFQGLNSQLALQLINYIVYKGIPDLCIGLGSHHIFDHMTAAKLQQLKSNFPIPKHSCV